MTKPLPKGTVSDMPQNMPENLITLLENIATQFPVFPGKWPDYIKNDQRIAQAFQLLSSVKRDITNGTFDTHQEKKNTESTQKFPTNVTVEKPETSPVFYGSPFDERLCFGGLLCEPSKEKESAEESDNSINPLLYVAREASNLYESHLAQYRLFLHILTRSKTELSDEELKLLDTCKKQSQCSDDSKDRKLSFEEMVHRRLDLDMSRTTSKLAMWSSTSKPVDSDTCNCDSEVASTTSTMKPLHEVHQTSEERNSYIQKQKIACLQGKAAEYYAWIDAFSGDKESYEYKRIEEALTRTMIELDSIAVVDSTIQAARKKVIDEMHNAQSCLDLKIIQETLTPTELSHKSPDISTESCIKYDSLGDSGEENYCTASSSSPTSLSSSSLGGAGYVTPPTEPACSHAAGDQAITPLRPGDSSCLMDSPISQAGSDIPAWYLHNDDAGDYTWITPDLSPSSLCHQSAMLNVEDDDVNDADELNKFYQLFDNAVVVKTPASTRSSPETISDENRSLAFTRHKSLSASDLSTLANSRDTSNKQPVCSSREFSKAASNNSYDTLVKKFGNFGNSDKKPTIAVPPGLTTQPRQPVDNMCEPVNVDLSEGIFRTDEAAILYNFDAKTRQRCFYYCMYCKIYLPQSCVLKHHVLGKHHVTNKIEYQTPVDVKLNPDPELKALQMQQAKSREQEDMLMRLSAAKMQQVKEHQAKQAQAQASAQYAHGAHVRQPAFQQVPAGQGMTYMQFCNKMFLQPMHTHNAPTYVQPINYAAGGVTMSPLLMNMALQVPPPPLPGINIIQSSNSLAQNSLGQRPRMMFNSMGQPSKQRYELLTPVINNNHKAPVMPSFTDSPSLQTNIPTSWQSTHVNPSHANMSHINQSQAKPSHVNPSPTLNIPVQNMRQQTPVLHHVSGYAGSGDTQAVRLMFPPQ